jgi:predicted metal-dependent peptidase
MPPLPGGINDEARLYARLLREGLDENHTGFGTAGPKTSDMIFADDQRQGYWDMQVKWPEVFAAGLSQAVRKAVDTAGGKFDVVYGDEEASSQAQTARNWFISSYPLLGAIASTFKIIENPQLCGRMEIHIAAVSPYLRELYINPAAGLTAMEYRFVMAHEFLHAALRHDVRHEWRDPYLWNVACDYVINLWLTEMGVGDRPPACLYDEQFKGSSAEAVYDRIVTDLRLFRKLATLRGVGLGDILPGGENWWLRGDGIDLDAFYRRGLGQGLSYHEEQGRGYLPAGLVEEIRALSHPPIPWDVELARWFDDHFTPLEKIRSYARPSRRQSSTPDIPRPNWAVSKAALDGRTFGVILDTSGSMDRALLAESLGAIASYAAARDVPGARVIFCDAEAYDQGSMKPEDIAGSVKVKGRGGTVLQPAIELLDKAEDFPKTAPLLIITDGDCDRHLILYGREHAYLIPEGRSLPFVAKGKVFRVRN